LTARFLYSIPVSLVGYRKINPVEVSLELRRVYEDIFTALLRIEVSVGTDNVLIVKPLQLDETAKQRFQDYQEQIERKLGIDGELKDVADWGSKLSGAVARIAGIFACN